MEADTKPILSALTEGFKTTAESTYTLHVPFQRNSGEISELAQAYFPSHSVATSPALNISVEGEIRSFYDTAAKAERDLCSLTSNTLNELNSEEARDNFMRALVKGSLTRNLLQRWRVRSKTSEQIAAGTYLGTPIHDAKLGKLLCAEITSAYDTSKLAKPDQTTLNRLCNEWGHAQALIRKTIIINSWKGLKQDRQPPSMAFDAFAVALEPNTPAKDLIERFKLGTHQLIGSLAPTEWDRISLFLAAAESLCEKALPQRLYDLQRGIRGILASQEQSPAVEEYFKATNDSRQDSLNQYKERLWPMAGSAPHYLRLERGVISAISISVKQAHRFFSEYLRHPSIDRIHIIASPSDNLTASEICELAHLPIAHQLASFVFAAEGSEKMEKECIMGFCQLTKELLNNSEWRSPNAAQIIELTCCAPTDSCSRNLAEQLARESIQGMRYILTEQDSENNTISWTFRIAPSQRRAVFIPQLEC